jgi:hypothetical protein
MKRESHSGPADPETNRFRELRTELREMGVKLRGDENNDELQAMLQKEMNRRWFASASQGRVIRRKRQSG